MMEVFTAPDKISAPTNTTKAWNAKRSGIGPARCIANPPIMLSRKPFRASSGMIMTAKNDTSEVNSSE